MKSRTFSQYHRKREKATTTSWSVDRVTGMPLTQVRFLVLQESTFNADSLTASVQSRVQPHALTSTRTGKILRFDFMSELGGF